MKTLLLKNKPAIDRVRYEPFGGIISCLNPPFLAWVDRDFMRKLGYADTILWENDPVDTHTLSAPTEVHTSVTNRCSQQCDGCYMDSSAGCNNELTTEEWKHHFKTLRDMGVFHVALGGGEAFERDDFGELVSYCRTIGLVPNLTTNGQSIGEKEVAICRQMGQVNISIDGINDRFTINGRQGSFEKADNAISLLKKAGVHIGINCVVSCKNYPFLIEVIEYASRRKLNEVEFLKYKPSGRGRQLYDEYALSQEMIREFYPMLLRFSKKYKMEIKIDCSFIPALAYHKPPKDELEKLAVTGCDGGNLLMAVRSDGSFSGCSFMENSEPVSEIKDRWRKSEHLNNFRKLVNCAKEPCKSCEYLETCRCGCRAVSVYKTGDVFAPDPECPFVYDFNQKENQQ
jgi:radical SAM protein with 4Fe4S-binding SPASM domain